jgi:hypothetical protein
MKDYSEIKSLFNELEYYEKKGLYKLSDQIQNKIKKIAYEFNADKDLGYAGMTDFFKKLQLDYACKIPECVEFLCGSGSNRIQITPDIANLLQKAIKQNPDASVQQLIPQIMQPFSQQANLQINLKGEKGKQFAACIAKAFGGYKQSQQQAVVSATTNQPLPTQSQTREFPPKL